MLPAKVADISQNKEDLVKRYHARLNIKVIWTNLSLYPNSSYITLYQRQILECKTVTRTIRVNEDIPSVHVLKYTYIYRVNGITTRTIRVYWSKYIKKYFEIRKKSWTDISILYVCCVRIYIWHCLTLFICNFYNILYIYYFIFYFFSVRLLSVLRGHTVISSPPQQPMTPDFKGFLYQILSIILILEKEPVFPF